MSRTVRINGTGITVKVPIFEQDWINFIAVDSDGEVWAFEGKPAACEYCWLYKENDGVLIGTRLLNETGTQAIAPIDMGGVDWRATMTPVDKSLSNTSRLVISLAGFMVLSLKNGQNDAQVEDIAAQLSSMLEKQLP